MEFQSKAVQMKENVSKVIVGKGNVTDLILTALIAGGHVLLEDVPGTGKTMIAKSFAKSIDAEFARIQFTPDLLPSLTALATPSAVPFVVLAVPFPFSPST